jgi:hypothetical protein
MNKRSAITIAAGMVLTLIVAAAAIAMGVTGPTQASAETSQAPAQPSPRVKTITHTIKVEKPGDRLPGAVVTIEGTTPAATSAASVSDDDAVEDGVDDHGEDADDLWDDHGDDDHDVWDDHDGGEDHDDD